MKLISVLLAPPTTTPSCPHLLVSARHTRTILVGLSSLSLSHLVTLSRLINKPTETTTIPIYIYIYEPNWIGSYLLINQYIWPPLDWSPICPLCLLIQTCIHTNLLASLHMGEGNHTLTITSSNLSRTWTTLLVGNSKLSNNLNLRFFFFFFFLVLLGKTDWYFNHQIMLCLLSCLCFQFCLHWNIYMCYFFFFFFVCEIMYLFYEQIIYSSFLANYKCSMVHI